MPEPCSSAKKAPPQQQRQTSPHLFSPPTKPAIVRLITHYSSLRTPPESILKPAIELGKRVSERVTMGALGIWLTFPTASPKIRLELKITLMQISSTDAQQHLDELCNLVMTTGQSIEITRDGAASVSLISTAELESLLETVYLFQSHENASRLLDALNRANTGGNSPQTVELLRQEFGLVAEEKASA